MNWCLLRQAREGWRNMIMVHTYIDSIRDTINVKKKGEQFYKYTTSTQKHYILNHVLYREGTVNYFCDTYLITIEIVKSCLTFSLQTN